MTNDELARFDVAEVHLACADGLPGAEKIDHRACIERLDQLAVQVGQFTESWLRRSDAWKLGATDAQRRMRCLGEYVWLDAGIVYNPKKTDPESPWDFEDNFIHGALFGPGGTCATLPIIYTAIARRLGYPAKLVGAYGEKAWHQFCRWDDPNGERFNFEVNHTGAGFRDDDHYRSAGQSPEMERKGHFLLSKTPRQELASFLSVRGLHLKEDRKFEEAADVFAWALGLAPTDEYTAGSMNNSYNAFHREVKKNEPPDFPQIYLTKKERRYRVGVPIAFENNFICLQLKSHLLKDPEAEQKWWRHLRAGNTHVRVPKTVEAFWRPGSMDCHFVS